MASQHQISVMVETHVKDNLTPLITHLMNGHEGEYYDEIRNVMVKDDFESAADDAGYEVHEDPDQPGLFYYMSPEGEGSDISYGSREEAWMAACDNNGLEPYYDEAYEWYAVTDWLGSKLKQRGEMVETIFGLTVWGRCTTGQAIYLDYVMENIYNTFDSK